MAKPRIAFIGAGVGFPSEKGTGQGLPVMTALVRRLPADFEVVLYSLIRINKTFLPAGIQLRQIAMGPLPLRIKYGLLILWFAWDHFRRPFKIINAISAYPAGRLCVYLGKLFRVPSMVHLIGSETVMIGDIGYGDLLNVRLKKIVEWVCRQADVVITVSEYQKKVAEQNMPGLNRLITVLPRRVEVEKFPYRERSISFPVVFLHIASYQPIKDHKTLFATFAKIAKSIDCTLTVIGDGFANAEVREMLDRLGITGKVKFVGPVGNEELCNWFAIAHVMLHTSRYEGLPGVVQEAMASGVPVCSTSVGTLDDLGESYAVLAPPQQPDTLAEQTLALVRNPGRYQAQAKLAREYILQHDANWSASQYKEFFNKWLTGHH